jgi:hypothetical protein
VESVNKSRSLYPEAEQELLDRIGWESIKRGSDDLFFTTSLSEVSGRGRADPEHFRPKFSALRQQLKSLGAATIDDLTIEIAKGTQPAAYDDQRPV